MGYINDMANYDQAIEESLKCSTIDAIYLSFTKLAEKAVLEGKVTGIDIWAEYDKLKAEIEKL